MSVCHKQQSRGIHGVLFATLYQVTDICTDDTSNALYRGCYCTLYLDVRHRHLFCNNIYFFSSALGVPYLCFMFLKENCNVYFRVKCLATRVYFKLLSNSKITTDILSINNNVIWINLLKIKLIEFVCPYKGNSILKSVSSYLYEKLY